MSNKVTAVQIDSAKIKDALKKAGISHSEMARSLGITYRSFMRSLNELHALQPVQILQIAKVTRSDPSDFYPEGSDSAAKQITDILDELRGYYNDADLKEWASMINRIFDFGIGDRFHKMKTKKERGDFITFIQAWILFANKYYDALTPDQHEQLIETCESIAEGMVRKNQSMR